MKKLLILILIALALSGKGNDKYLFTDTKTDLNGNLTAKEWFHVMMRHLKCIVSKIKSYVNKTIYPKSNFSRNEPTSS